MIKLYFRLTSLVLFLCLSLSANAQRLFQISRSLNRNLVYYDVQAENGKLNIKKPIHVYWHDNEKHPGRESELSVIERKLAYGYNVKSASEKEATVTLTSYSKRALKVCKQDGKWIATITINGKECQLQEIYVKTKTPVTVDYIELRGKTLNGGVQQKETIKP